MSGRLDEHPTQEERVEEEVEQTCDGDGRLRVAQGTPETWRERILPQLHGKWWNFDSERDRRTTKSCAQLFWELPLSDVEEARETLAHVEAIAQTAVERAQAADRRASTIAGSVAIAASFTLSGGALAIDADKLHAHGLRIAFALALFATTALFVASAAYALRALVRTHPTHWIDPHSLNPGGGVNAPVPTELRHRIGTRAAHLLDGFAGNWEISDLKNRNVDCALLCLLGALAGILLLAGLLVAAAIGA
ncbi:MAG TPA: hypothetical protein VKB25_12910 [Conexibacter sp.]|nr:hypothetical protein [Conexibacter sp.]